MADASFDAVVIGGGHQGLVISNYLALNGLSVGLFEMNRELGGLNAAEPRPAPGFVGNHSGLAGSHAATYFQDFKLYEKGLNILFPEYGYTGIFSNEKCLVAYPLLDWNLETLEVTVKDGVLEKNLAEIARLSPRDAETMMGVLAKMEKVGTAYHKITNTPPPLPGEFDIEQDLYNDPVTGIDPRWQFMTATDVFRDLFESEELICYCLRMMGTAGYFPDDIIPPVFYYAYAIFMLIGSTGGVWEGGTHNTTHALQRALSENGGQFFVGAEVDQVLVENERATGIRLADGTEIKAKQFVVDAAEIKQIVNRHLRDYEMDASVRRKINNLRSDRANLIWGHFAFTELPQYKAASWNPDCLMGRAIYTIHPDVEDMWRNYSYHHKHLRPGKWPEKLYFLECTESKFDPLYAPEGAHVTFLEEMGPPASWLSEAEWLQVRKEGADRYLQEWQKFAPNMTWDNVFAAQVETPLDISRKSANAVDGSFQLTALHPHQWNKFRPIPEFAQYQIPGIDNFWMASGSCHMSMAVMGHAAYCCYKRMVPKYGFRKIWEENGRDF